MHFETYVCINEKEKKMMQASAIPGLIQKKETLIQFRLDPGAGCLIRFSLCSLALITASVTEEATCRWV